MSEKKKVIHVKDLIIKADNVFIEPRHHKGPREVDPFFGKHRERDMRDKRDRESSEERFKRDRESSEERFKKESRDESREKPGRHEDRRRPFWF